MFAIRTCTTVIRIRVVRTMLPLCEIDRIYFQPERAYLVRRPYTGLHREKTTAEDGFSLQNGKIRQTSDVLLLEHLAILYCCVLCTSYITIL